jgi:hypothetical protein
VAGLTLDAGALIAFERNDRRMVALLSVAVAHGLPIHVPAGVVAQIWRDGRRQARLARLLGTPDVAVDPLDDVAAREAGQLCGLRGTTDVIDASVILNARRYRCRIASSDPDDLRRLDPGAVLIRV